MNARLIRQLHLYIGVLFAPTILFFALTGAAQLFKLHEEGRDSGYAPPALVEKLAQVHIHQRFAAKPKRPEGARPPAARAQAERAERPEAARPRPKDHPGAKWFFLFTALGLTITASLGLWMGLTHARERKLAWGLLAAGILLPILLVAL